MRCADAGLASLPSSSPLPRSLLPHTLLSSSGTDSGTLWKRGTEREKEREEGGERSCDVRMRAQDAHV
eukprot:203462-Rhodomonas_salina.1